MPVMGSFPVRLPWASTSIRALGSLTIYSPQMEEVAEDVDVDDDVEVLTCTVFVGCVLVASGVSIVVLEVGVCGQANHITAVAIITMAMRQKIRD